MGKAPGATFSRLGNPTQKARKSPQATQLEAEEEACHLPHCPYCHGLENTLKFLASLGAGKRLGFLQFSFPHLQNGVMEFLGDQIAKGTGWGE
jgi:hypothetical protein